MDKPVITKLPATGQLNALGQEETDFEMGDFIYVRMDVSRQNTVDIYCHAQSARVAGIGENLLSKPAERLIEMEHVGKRS